MSALNLNKGNMLSRKIRTGFIEGKIGKAMLEGGKSALRKTQNQLKFQKKQIQKNGIINWIVGGTARLVGFVLSKALGFIGWSFSAAFGWLVEAAMTISTINWNATDEELAKTIEGYEISTAASWGSFVGQSLGWFAGVGLGVGLSFTLPVIGGAALARKIATSAGKEALEELYLSLQGTLRQQVRNATAIAIIRQYIGLRQTVKNAAKNDWLPQDVKERVEKWGSKGAPRFVIGEKIEETIEKIPDKKLRAFVSNAVEEFFDSFIEAGYVVAYELDNAYAQAKRASAAMLGESRQVTIDLNKDAPTQQKEILRLPALPQKLMQQEIVRSLNTYRMIHSRDIGLVMGLPMEEYTKAKPQSLRLVIDCYSVKQPPFFRKAEGFVWATLTISDVKRAALDWEIIKRAIGGANGYLWGRFRATAQLSTGRRIVIHAGSEKEAEERVNAILQLTEANLLTLNITEEKRVAERLKKQKLYKNTTRVYPGFFTVLNREELLDPTQGRAATRQNNYRDARVRIPLWTKTAPSNVSDLIRQVLTKGL